MFEYVLFAALTLAQGTQTDQTVPVQKGTRLDISNAAGEVKIVASPLKLGGTPVVEPVAPPMLGADTRAALTGLGYTVEQIGALLESGAVA